MSDMNKRSPLEKAKSFVFDNKVILLFVLLSVVCTLYSGANISYVAGEVFSRFGRNTCLVLGLIIFTPPVSNHLLAGTDISDTIRQIIQNGVILYALAQAKGGSSND